MINEGMREMIVGTTSRMLARKLFTSGGMSGWRNDGMMSAISGSPGMTGSDTSLGSTGVRYKKPSSRTPTRSLDWAVLALAWASGRSSGNARSWLGMLLLGETPMRSPDVEPARASLKT